MKFFFLVCLLLFTIGCNNKPSVLNPNFISIKNGKFFLKGKPFFPIMLNYVVCIRDIENKPVISCTKQYEHPDIFEVNTLKSNENQLRAHLQLIKEMGFNSLRLVFDRANTDYKGLYYGEKKRFYIDEDYNSILQALDKYLKLVEEYDLKVMLLLKKPLEDESLENFTVKLLTKFKSNPTIYAYDFFNEPLYFDLPPNGELRDKNDIIKIVKHWGDLVNEYAPNQLFTIGFSEPIEVFRWDPSILPLDFISFHTYHPLRVPNEIYWYSKYTNKPWLISETALPSDNDSISYKHQSSFMREVYQRIIDCNGIGIGWWEFQELNFSHFEARYSGLLNHEGTTFTSDGKYKIIGTVKPAVKEIKKFANYKKRNCDCKPNYYNMLGYSNFLLKGRILDDDSNLPIEGAVIRGWNDDWSIGQNTFSDKNGYFTLYSNDQCNHFEVSAPGMETEKFDKKNKYVKSKNAIRFQNRKLEYHKISYFPFLRIKENSLDTNFQTDSYIFNFDKKYFNKYLFKGNLGVIKITKI
jgi:hypothetical protein